MTTPVIFRKESYDKFIDGMIIAFFPTLPGTHVPSSCSCYAHIGQHGTAHKDYYTQNTSPATPEEYKDLQDELESIGYDLEIFTRWQSWMDKRRLQELEDMYE